MKTYATIVMLMIQNPVNETETKKPQYMGLPLPTREGKEIESIPFCVGFVLMFWGNNV